MFEIKPNLKVVPPAERNLIKPEPNKEVSFEFSRLKNSKLNHELIQFAQIKALKEAYLG